MNAPDHDSDDNIFTATQHSFNQKRTTCIYKITDERKQVDQHIQYIDQHDPSAKRRGRYGLYSKLECMREYHAALTTLLERFERATTEEEGKDDFRYDIKQIERDMKVVFAAGWVNIKNIMLLGGFARITGLDDESDQSDATSSMLSMLSADPATPRTMRSGRKIQ